jgi:5-methylcytosine-specific restriction endonuclease McrA
MDLHEENCYNGTNHIRNGRALLEAAPAMRQQEASPVSDPIISPENPQLKRCTQCGELKPREAYQRDSYAKDGLQRRCRDCFRVYHSERGYAAQKSYQERNREKMNARAREHARERYAENPEHYREVSRQWRAANPNKVVEGRRTQLENGGRERKRAYYRTERGREVQRTYKSNRRARERSSVASLTPDDITAIRAAQTDKRGRLHCWWCGKTITDAPHLDHKIALARGGNTVPENMCYACSSCNKSKQTKTPAEFAGRLL